MEPNQTGLKTCPKCAAQFECGIANGQENCWCFDCPRILPVVENAECLCPQCLRQELRLRFLMAEGNVPSPPREEGTLPS